MSQPIIVPSLRVEAASGPPNAMPFDGKRMMWGGFKSIVEM